MDDRTTGRLRFVINVAYFAVIAGLIFLAFHYVISWVLPFILAFVIVSIVHPIIRRIKKLLRIESDVISLIIMMLVYVLVCFLLFTLLTQLFYWARDLFTDLEGFYERTLNPAILSIGNAFSRFLNRLPAQWQMQFDNWQEQLLSFAQQRLLGLSQTGLSVLSTLSTRIPVFVFALLFTVMLSFFISMQYDTVIITLKRLLPIKAQKNLDGFKLILRQTILQYLRALFTLMMITGVELSVGLMVLGRPLSSAIPSAFGIALFDALPFVGTGAIMVPWTIIELLQGNTHFGIGLGILYAIITLVRNIIEPKIVSDKLGINPIVSLVAIYLGLRTMGVLGMIIMPILVQLFFALHQAGSFPGLQRMIPIAPQKSQEKKL